MRIVSRLTLLLGAVGFLVGFLWLAYLVYRRGKRRGQDNIAPSDYASSIGKPSRFNFKWPSLPFSRGAKADGGETGPRASFRSSFRNAPRRSNTSIMNEAMRAAYGGDRESLNANNVPEGFFNNEKRTDASFEPAAIPNATIRRSMASWFRRSSSAHPLKLNPNIRWSRSTTRSATTVSADSEAQYPASIYSASIGGGGSNEEDVPPMPALDTRRYTAATTITTTPSISATPDLPTNPMEAPVFTPLYSRTLTETPAPYNSHWSQASSARSTRMFSFSTRKGGATVSTRSSAATGMSTHERMSSLTNATESTFGGTRESVPQVATALSPPAFHRATSSVGRDEDAAELTHLREELLELYKAGAQRPVSVVEGPLGGPQGGR